MPANVVKPGTEKYWERAKQSCSKYKEGTKRYYKCVNGTYQRIMANVEGVSRFKQGKK